jgi:hypothetical protein
MISWIPAVPGGLADPNKIEPQIGPFPCRFGQSKEDTHPIYGRVSSSARAAMLRKCDTHGLTVDQFLELAMTAYTERRENKEGLREAFMEAACRDWEEPPSNPDEVFDAWYKETYGNKEAQA